MFSSFYNQQSYSTTGVVKTEVNTKIGVTVNKKKIIEEVATAYDLSVAKS